jgi:hypothetical protein
MKKMKFNNKFPYFSANLSKNANVNANVNANANVNTDTKNILSVFFIIIIIALNIVLINIFTYNSKVLDYNSIIQSNNIIENFDTEKYIDVCKNKKTQFYDINTSKLTNELEVSNNSECELLCDQAKCDIFLLKDISNSTSKKCGLFTDISGSYDTDLTLNCESNILPPNEHGVYNGYGFVNKFYFKDNNDAFNYIDRYLEETEYIIDDLSYISYLHKTASGLDLTNSNGRNYYDYLQELKLRAYNDLLNVINDVNNRIFYSSKNILFTDLFNKVLSQNESSGNILMAQKRDLSFVNLIGKSDIIDKNSEILENKQNTLFTNYKSINGIYLILFIIMVLTIPLLILYYANIISEFLIICYFIFVILLILFINNIVKI